MKKFLITGGTGSLGSQLTKKLIELGYSVVIFSRDEQKQFRMRLHYEDVGGDVSFVIGNIQDEDSINSAIRTHVPDIVIHTAAQKHVRVCDENPAQTVSTNILGTAHVVNACIDNDIEIGFFVSTDKAESPTTLYGMSKAVAERIVMNASHKQHKTRLVGARYGNIITSEGSLLPLYKTISESSHKVFKVTHENMTRFFMTSKQAVDLTLNALNATELPAELSGNFDIHSWVNHIFAVPKLQAMRIIDVAELFAEKCGGKIEMTKPYPSEKFHEDLAPGYTSCDHLISKDELKKILIQEKLL